MIVTIVHVGINSEEMLDVKNVSHVTEADDSLHRSLGAALYKMHTLPSELLQK